MSSGKKQQKKRKRFSSPPFKSQIARRLEKLRGEQRNLWADDDDDEQQPKTTNNKKASIALSDSDEGEQPSSSHRRLKSTKSKNKISQNHNKNATCLICSILSQLSSYNCCSQHLTALKNPQQSTISQFLPDQVMILPITDEILQRYLDPQQIHRLRTQTSTNEISSERNILTQKSLNKSTTTLDPSEVQQEPLKNIPNSSINSNLIDESAHIDIQPIASTIVIESARSNSATVPPDVTITTISSPISTKNNVENIIPIDTSQLQQSSIIEENTLRKSSHEQRQIDPWTPISDEIDAALEQALNQIDSSCDSLLEFTPATVRRTETEIMAACLPKVLLKQGRYRKGKPIIDRPASNAANEYRPLAAAQSSPSTSLVIAANVCPIPSAPNIEKERSSQTPNRFENTTDNDIATNSIFTQDIENQYDNIPTITSSSEDLLSVTNQAEINRSNGTHSVTSSATHGRNLPARISFRLNPDGTRVSISRPPLPTNHQSPLTSSLRRTSTDVTPIQSNTKQV